MPPPIHVTPKSPPSECSKTSSSQHESIVQLGRANSVRDDLTIHRSENQGKDPNDGDVGDGEDDSNDEEGDCDEKKSNEDGDKEDDNSDKSRPSSTTSTISGLSLPNEGYILEIARRSDRWAPAMLELPKQRILRCKSDWKTQKLKSEILRAARKAEEYYKISKQKQEQTVRLHEETMQYHQRAEQQIKRTEALMIKLNDETLSRGGRP